MSWNFTVNADNVCRVRWIVIVFRINYVPAWRGTSLRECPGIVKRCTQGLARTRIALCQRPGADTEETGRYDLAWKDLCEYSDTLQ